MLVINILTHIKTIYVPFNRIDVVKKKIAATKFQESNNLYISTKYSSILLI
jgi:hypothetical protein